MNSIELDENWRRACRANPDLNRFDEPAPNVQLVSDVLSRVRGNGHPPDSVLKGLARGFAMSGWEGSPEATYLQLATLVIEASRAGGADLAEALQVLAIVGDASVNNLLDIWRTEAEEDRLTRLGNRRRMESTTRNLVKAKRHFEYASIDVDGLKAVNDGQGGHEAGDELLKTVATHLRSSLPGDLAQAFRYGGDEFGVVFEEVAGATVTLSTALEEVVKTLPAGISFSWGVSAWPDDDIDVHTIVRYADERMYEQKRSKRPT